MIKGTYLNGMIDDCSDCYVLRETIFKDFILTDEEGQKDAMGIHVLLLNERMKPVGNARLSFSLDGFFEFDYFGVLESERKNGYGDFIMHMLIDKANGCGAEYLVSKQEAALNHPFFKKYGFVYKENQIELNIKEFYNTHKCCH